MSVQVWVSVRDMSHWIPCRFIKRAQTSQTSKLAITTFRRMLMRIATPHGSKLLIRFIIIFRFGTSLREEKRRNTEWPGPNESNLPEYTTNGRKTKFPPQITDQKQLDELRKAIYKKDDGLGPGQYHVKLPTSAPIRSFGTRFNSSIRSKDHLKPKKVDGPGPGAYKLPGSVVVKDEIKGEFKTTFGTSARNFIDLPQKTPAPNKYRPVHLTECSAAYTIPNPPPQGTEQDSNLIKQKLLPGPGSYNNMKAMAEEKKHAKTMLGAGDRS